MKKALLIGFTLLAVVGAFAQPMYRKFIAPNFTTAGRPACPTSGPTGYIYWDTTATKLQVCDGSAYADLGVALSGANTWTGLNTFARTAAGNDACFGATATICIDGDSGFITGSLSASILELRISTTNVFDVLPIPSAGSGGSLLSAASTLTAMNGSDTVVLLDVTTTNANHTGANNTLNGIRVASITGDADATENATFFGTGWDSHLTAATLILTGTDAIRLASGDGSTVQAIIQPGQEAQFRSTTTALAVVGAAQTVDPVAMVQHIGAGAAADVTIVARPTNGQASNQSTRVTFICDDGNVTFTNADGGGAQTIDLAGNFTCSARDTLTLAYDVTNDRWVEVARSVN